MRKIGQTSFVGMCMGSLVIMGAVSGCSSETKVSSEGDNVSLVEARGSQDPDPKSAVTSPGLPETKAAAPSNATDSERRYLAELDRTGVLRSDNFDDATAIAAGNLVCKSVAAKASESSLRIQLAPIVAGNDISSAVIEARVTKVINAATQSLCTRN